MLTAAEAVDNLKAQLMNIKSLPLLLLLLAISHASLAQNFATGTSEGTLTSVRLSNGAISICGSVLGGDARPALRCTRAGVMPGAPFATNRLLINQMIGHTLIVDLQSGFALRCGVTVRNQLQANISATPWCKEDGL